MYRIQCQILHVSSKTALTFSLFLLLSSAFQTGWTEPIVQTKKFIILLAAEPIMEPIGALIVVAGNLPKAQ